MFVLFLITSLGVFFIESFVLAYAVVSFARPGLDIFIKTGSSFFLALVAALTIVMGNSNLMQKDNFMLTGICTGVAFAALLIRQRMRSSVAYRYSFPALAASLLVMIMFACLTGAVNFLIYQWANGLISFR